MSTFTLRSSSLRGGDSLRARSVVDLPGMGSPPSTTATPATATAAANSVAPGIAARPAAPATVAK